MHTAVNARKEKLGAVESHLKALKRSEKAGSKKDKSAEKAKKASEQKGIKLPKTVESAKK